MSHAEAILNKQKDDPAMIAGIAMVKLVYNLGKMVNIVEQKEKEEARKFTAWLRSLDDEKSKEIAFMLEMSAYHIDIFLDMRKHKED